MTQRNDTTTQTREMAQQAAHTPGPWTFNIVTTEMPCCGKTSSSVGYIKADSDHREVAVLYGHENQHANARLIAAAPELLDTLTRIESYLGDFCDQGVLDGHPAFVQWTAVRAAIAKAEGRP